MSPINTTACIRTESERGYAFAAGAAVSTPTSKVAKEAMSRIPGLKKEPSLPSLIPGVVQLPKFGIALAQDKEEEVAEVHTICYIRDKWNFN